MSADRENAVLWILLWEHTWRPGARWIKDGALYYSEQEALKTLGVVALETNAGYYRNIRGPFRWQEPSPQPQGEKP